MFKRNFIFFLSTIILSQSLPALAFWPFDTEPSEEQKEDQELLEKISDLQTQITNDALDVRDVLVDNTGGMVVGGAGSIIAGIVVQKLGKVSIQNSEQMMAKSAADLVKVASTYIGQVNGTAGKMVTIVETVGADVMLPEGASVVARNQMRKTLVKGAVVALKDMAIDYGYRGVIFLGRGLVVAGAVSSGVGTAIVVGELVVQAVAGDELNVGEAGELFFASSKDFKSRFSLSTPQQILTLYKQDPQFKSRLNAIL
jgi:hypothetical protein